MHFWVIIISKCDSFFLWFDRLWWHSFFKKSVISPREGVTVIILILSKLKSGIISILLYFLRNWIVMSLSSTEKSLECWQIIIFVMMRVFELMDISYLWKVFFIYIVLSFQLTHSFEDATIWFVYFHLLKLLVP